MIEQDCPDIPLREEMGEADLKSVLPPGAWSDLEEEFRQLGAHADAQGRGKKLERLLERLFQRAHFRVELDPPGAEPRQTDLMVSWRDATYLVEAKWTGHKSGSPEADDIRIRLEEVGKRVIGVLVTVSGINAKFAARVVAQREKGLIIALDEQDLLQVLRDPPELVRMLALKVQELEVFARVHVGGDSPQQHTDMPAALTLPDSTRSLAGLDGTQSGTCSGQGFISPVVFAVELPDIDWAFSSPSAGVSLDVPLASRSEAELLRALHLLNAMGWVSRHAHWTIQKMGQVWHGIGARSFVETLPRWSERLESGGDESGTESIVFFDACEGGWYTISADLGADEFRRTLRANLSMQLPGVPLDTGPLHQLFQQFGTPLRGFFRPLAGKSVRRGFERPPWQPLQAVGLVIEQGDESGDAWAVGVVAKNPFYPHGTVEAPADWPWQPEDSELLICALRSHHPVDEPKDYFLWSWESAETSDAMVARVVVEW